jgi:hypothetical protein
MSRHAGLWLTTLLTLGACAVHEPPPSEPPAAGVLDEAPPQPAAPPTVVPEAPGIDAPPVAKSPGEANAPAAPSSAAVHEGLAKYAEEEDRVRKALLDAKRARNTADVETLTAKYKALISESDEYARRVVTPEFIASIPWTDLLSDEMAARWSKSTSVPGFALRIEHGVLTTTSPEPGCKMQAVAAILDQRQDDLRNFELDMEFEVEGTVTMFFHVSPAPQNPDNRQSHAFDLVAKDGALKPNRKYQMSANLIGSALTLDFPPIGDEEPIASWSPDPSWVKLRKGGIAFLVPEGARLKITRMRIKILR